MASQCSTHEPGQMCFKSEIVAEIARLHENSAYSILGVSPDASDAVSWAASSVRSHEDALARDCLGQI